MHSVHILLITAFVCGSVSFASALLTYLGSNEGQGKRPYGFSIFTFLLCIGLLLWAGSLP